MPDQVEIVSLIAVCAALIALSEFQTIKEVAPILKIFFKMMFKPEIDFLKRIKTRITKSSS